MQDAAVYARAQTAKQSSVFPKSMLLHANDAECKEGAAGVP